MSRMFSGSDVVRSVLALWSFCMVLAVAAGLPYGAAVLGAFDLLGLDQPASTLEMLACGGVVLVLFPIVAPGMWLAFRVGVRVAEGDAS